MVALGYQFGRRVASIEKLPCDATEAVPENESPSMTPDTRTDPNPGCVNVKPRTFPSSVTDSRSDVWSVRIVPDNDEPEPVIVKVPSCSPPGVATEYAHVPVASTTASGSAPSCASSSLISYLMPSTKTKRTVVSSTK